MAKQDEKLQAYEELTTQMNASTVALDAEKRQKLYEILHQKPEFAQLLEKFKALCSDDETRKAISEVCPASEADEHFDFKAMLQSMGAYCKIDPDKDGYVFNWPGKQTAIQLANEPTENTLIPDKADSRDWDTTQNIYIEGDNLEALKCLRNAYAGKVKMIYIDPPYNTDADVIYNDYFHGEKVSSDDAGKHTKWLNMMYPRLMLARELLSEDGVVFVSISDIEFSKLKQLMDSVFGECNFLNDIIWNSTKSVTNTAIISVSHTHNLIYFKSKKYYIENREKFRLPDDGEGFTNPDNDPRGPWKADPFQVGGWRPNQQYDIINPNTGAVFRPNPGSSWKNDKKRFLELLDDNRIVFGKSGEAGPSRKRFIWEAEERGKVAKTIWDDIETTTNGTQTLKSLFNDQVIFSNPKPVGLIDRMIQLGTENNSIVLDFFSGSSTTAHSVLQTNNNLHLNNRFIMIQLPEIINPINNRNNELTNDINNIAISFLDGLHKPHNIAEIGKERIRRAGDKIKSDNPLTTQDLDIGFRVFRVGKSNIPKWWAVDDAQRQLNMFDNEEDKRTEEEKYRAIAYEFMLKHKCMLDARVDEYLTPEQMAKTGGKPLFVVDGALFICPVGGVNAAWATSVVALRRSRYAMTSNDAWFVAVNDTLDDSSDNRDSDKLLAVKTLVEAGLPAKHFLHI